MDKSLLNRLKTTTIGGRNKIPKYPQGFKCPLASQNFLSFSGQLVRRQTHTEFLTRLVNSANVNTWRDRYMCLFI